MWNGTASGGFGRLVRIAGLAAALWTAPQVASGSAASAVFDLLDAEPIACPETVVEHGPSDEASCVLFEGAWKTLKKNLKKLPKVSDLSFVEAEWRVRKGFGIRHVLAPTGAYRIVFDRETGWLAVLPGHPCLDGDDLAGAVVLGGEHAADPPIRVQRVKPEYPAEARRQRVDGTVTLHVIVREDGRVGAACVVESTTPGAGFEEAALAAVRQWVYEPVVRDGAARRALVTAEIRFFIP